MVAANLIEMTLGLFGRGRAKLGEWPHREIVEFAVATIVENGGEIVRESGSPAGELEVIHFRLGGRSLRLSVEEYGDVTLGGPSGLVARIADCVADRIAH